VNIPTVKHCDYFKTETQVVVEFLVLNVEHSQNQERSLSP